MKSRFSLLGIALFVILASCTNNNATTSAKDPVTNSKDSAAPNAQAQEQDTKNLKPATAAEILARKQVPVLCYHHIRDVIKSKYGYDVSINTFKDHMKTLHDSGYHSILPDQLYDYLVYGKALPEKPFMITYDDTDEEQFTIGKTEMDKYGFKGVYFIMTISIGKKNYMTKEQIKQLSDEGNTVACHTWDHHRADRYTGEDWKAQLDKPKKQIEDIIGKPVKDFAYPFGVWSPAGFPELKQRDIQLAFQLSTKRDSTQPLYTVRRIIVAPEFSGPGLIRGMNSSFK
jgi:peptidoglycan/xylan/chitin deacetylase (PgdA/CDA1 family)